MDYDEEVTNTTANFLRTVLVALCANFDPYFMPEGEWECRFRSEYYYQLKSLQGKTLKLTTLQKPPLSGTVIDEYGEVRGTGIAFDVIHEIQRRVGFNYNITLPAENTLGNQNFGIMKLLHNHDLPVGSGTDFIMKRVEHYSGHGLAPTCRRSEGISREVDMAAVFIPVTEMFRNYASFSSALAEFEWVLMMARPSASASGSGLLAPFQGMVWMFILISLIIAGPTMYFIVYLRSKFCSSGGTAESTKQYTLPSCVWFVYGALMKQGSTLSPVSDSPRLFFATWWIFITILTSFYTANLTAFLTLSEFTLTIQTPNDIFRHNRQWMADKGGYTEALIGYEDVFQPLRRSASHHNQFSQETPEERLKRVSKGAIYISEKRKAQQYLLRDYMDKAENSVPEKKRCTYVLTPKTILTKAVAFGYAKNSTLQHLLDPMLTYFVHGGIIGHLLDENLPLTTICPLNLATRERKLKNSDLMTTYKVVAVGFGSSLIAFVGEVVHRMINKRLQKKKQKSKANLNLGNNQFTKFPLAEKEPKLKNALNNDFVISQYYKEIMVPYSIPFRNMNSVLFEQERNARQLIPSNQPANFLFQYTN